MLPGISSEEHVALTTAGSAILHPNVAIGKIGRNASDEDPSEGAELFRIDFGVTAFSERDTKIAAVSPAALLSATVRRSNMSAIISASALKSRRYRNGPVTAAAYRLLSVGKGADRTYGIYAMRIRVYAAHLRLRQGREFSGYAARCRLGQNAAEIERMMKHYSIICCLRRYTARAQRYTVRRATSSCPRSDKSGA